MTSLPKIGPIAIFKERLPKIFPEGTPNRNYCIRDLAVSTVYTMLYVGAVEGANIYVSPKHVYRMTDEQSLKVNDEERIEYRTSILKSKLHVTGTRWYQDNTREPIRDETLKEGLISLGVVIIDGSVPTTSMKPRYALKSTFADLFNPDLNEEQVLKKIASWQNQNLSKSALARITILRIAANVDDKIPVNLPSKEIRFLEQGPSSVIAKNVIEVFAHNFLVAPFLLWLSESGNKVVLKDDKLANDLGITVDPSKHLPDIILADLGKEQNVTFVFIEIVASDGPITQARKEAFYALTDKGGYSRSDVLFVTAYSDRDSAAFKKTISQVSWDSYVWFASEPENIFILKEGKFKLKERRF